MDNGARNYYLSLMSGSGDDATPVATWSPTFLPVKTPLDSYECRHGIGYTTFHTDYQGIESTLTAFVPLHTAAEINHLSVRNNTGEAVTVDVTGCVEWCLWNAVDDESTLTAFVPLHTAAEINHLSVRNNTGEAVTVDVTGCVEWCLWNAVDDASNFQRNLSTGEVEVEQTGTNTIVYHKTEFKERRNHYAFFSVNEPTVGSNFQRNLSTGEVEVEQTGTNTIVYHKTEFKERRNHYAFFSVNEPTVGFDTSRDEFLGQFNGWDSPQAIAEGRMRDSVAHGWYPIAAERVRLTLQPGEERMLVFMLGYIEVPDDQKWEDPNDPAKVGIINKQPAHELFARFNTSEKVLKALDELSASWDELLGRFQVSTGDGKLDRMVNIWNQYQCMVTFNLSRSASYYESGMGWDELLGRFQVSTGDGKLDRMVNIWNQYQCMVTFNLSRSASYYESGMGRGMGFRDSNQDLLGFVHMIPGRARSRILDIAATQLPDGSAWHQYQPLTKKGNADIGGGFNDDPLWLVAGVFAYLNETGDDSILREPTQFDNQEGSEQPLLEHLRRSVDDPLWLVAGVFAYLNETGDDSILREPTQFDNQEGSEQPLLEHLRRSVHFTMTHRGPHGLPLIGRADWNDCLNLNCFSSTPGESFQTVENNDTGIAESVFIAGMFVLYGEQYAQILERFGEACGMEAADVQAEAAAVRAAIGEVREATLTAGWDGAWFRRAYDANGNPVGTNEDADVQAEAAAVRAAIGEVREATLTAGWDGAWFRRAYDANGNPVGTNEDSEGKIYIEPQGMCVMAGIGTDDGKAAQALRSTKDLLTCRWGTAILASAYSTYRIELGEISSMAGIGTDDGKAAQALRSTKDLLTCRWGTAILASAYSTYRIELGEISSYPRGYKENGGIFCHNNPWISIANATIGNDDEAFNVYTRTCPAYVEQYSEVHRTEPYVYCQIGSRSPTPQSATTTKRSTCTRAHARRMWSSILKCTAPSHTSTARWWPGSPTPQSATTTKRSTCTRAHARRMWSSIPKCTAPSHTSTARWWPAQRRRRRAKARTRGSPAPPHGPSWTSRSICWVCSPHSMACASNRICPRSAPHRAIRLLPDGGRPRGADAGRRHELVAHRHRRMDLRGRLAASAGCAAHIRWPAHRTASARAVHRAAHRARMAWRALGDRCHAHRQGVPGRGRQARQRYHRADRGTRNRGGACLAERLIRISFLFFPQWSGRRRAKARTRGSPAPPHGPS